MDVNFICELLGQAVSNADGELDLSGTERDDETAVALEFLVGQGWMEENYDGATWKVTRSGRFWFTSLSHGDIVKFHFVGNAPFLLHTRGSGRETIVWRNGKFATISTSRRFLGEEYFEIRVENEPVTADGGSLMDFALAKACAMLDDELEEPQSPTADALRHHVMDYLGSL